MVLYSDSVTFACAFRRDLTHRVSGPVDLILVLILLKGMNEDAQLLVKTKLLTCRIRLTRPTKLHTTKRRRACNPERSGGSGAGCSELWSCGSIGVKQKPVRVTLISRIRTPALRYVRQGFYTALPELPQGLGPTVHIRAGLQTRDLKSDRISAVAIKQYGQDKTSKG